MHTRDEVTAHVCLMHRKARVYMCECVIVVVASAPAVGLAASQGLYDGDSKHPVSFVMTSKEVCY